MDYSSTNITRAIGSLVLENRYTPHSLCFKFLRMLIPSNDDNTAVDRYWFKRDIVVELQNAIRDVSSRLVIKSDIIYRELLEFKFDCQSCVLENHGPLSIYEQGNIHEAIIYSAVHDTYGSGITIASLAKLCIKRLSDFLGVSEEDMVQYYIENADTQYEDYETGITQGSEYNLSSLMSILVNMEICLAGRTIDYFGFIKWLANSQNLIVIHYRYFNALFRTTEFSPNGITIDSIRDKHLKIEYMILAREYERYAAAVVSADWISDCSVSMPLIPRMHLPVEQLLRVLRTEYQNRLIDNDFIYNLEYEMSSH